MSRRLSLRPPGHKGSVDFESLCLQAHFINQKWIFDLAPAHAPNPTTQIVPPCGAWVGYMGRGAYAVRL